jgi:hypothetical protein
VLAQRSNGRRGGEKERDANEHGQRLGPHRRDLLRNGTAGVTRGWS